MWVDNMSEKVFSICTDMLSFLQELVFLYSLWYEICHLLVKKKYWLSVLVAVVVWNSVITSNFNIIGNLFLLKYLYKIQLISLNSYNTVFFMMFSILNCAVLSLKFILILTVLKTYCINYFVHCKLKNWRFRS